jgi:type IV secretion system protein VirB10
MNNEHNTLDQTPDALVKPGRRPNKVPLKLAFGVGMVLFLVIASVLHSKLNNNSQALPAQQSDQQRPEPANTEPLFGHVQQSGEIRQDQPRQQGTTPLVDREDANEESEQSHVMGPDWQEYQKAVSEIERQRFQSLTSALTASTTVSNGSQSQPTSQANRMMSGASPVALPAALGAGNAVDTDPNKQNEKAAWLNQDVNKQDYLQESRKSPLSPYEVKAGTIIPSVIISGINSDLPGQLIAEVSQNVYDTATGQYLLIPQGSRLVGTYDNHVSYGQSRVLVAWNRVIYPDASSLDIDMMPGADQGGYAGFNDKVNNHYARAFGSALLISLFSAGLQLSQPQATNGENYSSTQIIAASVGQQMGELGMEMARRGLNIAPTVEIRPGYQFNVMVTKDIILKPWYGN